MQGVRSAQRLKYWYIFYTCVLMLKLWWSIKNVQVMYTIYISYLEEETTWQIKNDNDHI